jgi:hypothetical protein
MKSAFVALVLASALSIAPVASAPFAPRSSDECWIPPGGSFDNGLVKVTTSPNSQAWISVSPCTAVAGEVTTVNARDGVPFGEPVIGAIDNYGGEPVVIVVDHYELTGFLELRGSNWWFLGGPPDPSWYPSPGDYNELPQALEFELFGTLDCNLYASAGLLSLSGHALWGRWPTGSQPPPVSPFGTGPNHVLAPGETWDNTAVKVSSGEVYHTEPQPADETSGPYVGIFPKRVQGQTHSWALGTQTVVYSDDLTNWFNPYKASWAFSVHGLDRDDMVHVGRVVCASVEGHGGWVTTDYNPTLYITCLPASPSKSNIGIHITGELGPLLIDRLWFGPDSTGYLCICD